MNQEQNPQEGIGGAGAVQEPPAGAQERGFTLGGSGSTGEMQAAVVQLGRIADLLQDLLREYKGNSPQRPQPFGQ